MDTLANTPIFTEHLAFKADIQNDWTLCIKCPISEFCRQLILLDAGSNYSVIRDFDADNWSCCTLDQITLQIEVCFWNRQLILPFYAGSNYSAAFNISASSPIYWSFLSLEIEWSKFTGHLALMFINPEVARCLGTSLCIHRIIYCFIENFGALVGTTNVHHAIKPFLLLASHTLFHLMVHIQDK